MQFAVIRTASCCPIISRRRTFEVGLVLRKSDIFSYFYSSIFKIDMYLSVIYFFKSTIIEPLISHIFKITNHRWIFLYNIDSYSNRGLLASICRLSIWSMDVPTIDTNYKFLYSSIAFLTFQYSCSACDWDRNRITWGNETDRDRTIAVSLKYETPKFEQAVQLIVVDSAVNNEILAKFWNIWKIWNL